MTLAITTPLDVYQHKDLTTHHATSGNAEVKAGFGSAAIKGGDTSCLHPCESREGRAKAQILLDIGELMENMRTAPYSLLWTIGAILIEHMDPFKEDGKGPRLSFRSNWGHSPITWMRDSANATTFC